jgi:glycosyltransferase involved in cell wall biosynthesis
MVASLPRVSIGIPVYNTARFLRASLDALLAQSFIDFELIISDNASTDETPEICGEYAAKDRRIKYLRNHSNLGAAYNYNRVFQAATAPYFKWAAADDLCAPDFIARCVEVLDRDPWVVLCYPKTILIDERDRILGAPADSLHLTSPNPVARFVRCLASLRLCNAVMGLIRSSVLAKTALIGPYPGSDVVLLAELSLHGKFHELPDPLFFRRFHPGAASNASSLASTQEFIAPRTRGRLFMRTWRHHYEYLAAIRRAPLSPTDRFRLGYTVIRHAISARRTLFHEVSEALGDLGARVLRG